MGVQRERWQALLRCGLVIVIGSLLALLPSGRGPASANGGPADGIYGDLKHVEAVYIPPKAQTFDVGAFDFMKLFNSRGKGGQKGIPDPPPFKRQFSAAAPNVTLVFHSVGWGARVDVSYNINGHHYDKSAHTDKHKTASVFVGVADNVYCSVKPDQQGIPSYRGSVTISGAGRSIGNLGVGAFTIPVLPFLVLYEPPGINSWAEYTTVETAGTNIGFYFSKEQSTSRPGSTGFESLDKYRNGLAVASVSATLAGQGGLAKGLQFAASDKVLGSAKATWTSGTKVTSDHRLGVYQTIGNLVRTQLKLGLGRGDAIVFVRDARVAWRVMGEEAYLDVLGWSRWDTVAVDSLKEGKVTGLSDFVVKALLALDPFATGGVNVWLSPIRFRERKEYGAGGAIQEWWHTYTVDEEFGKATESYLIEVQELNPGLLSVLGIGPQEARTDTLITRYGGTEGTREGREVTVKIHLEFEPTTDYWTAPLGLDRMGQDLAHSDEARKRGLHHESKTQVQRRLQAAGGGGAAGGDGDGGAVVSVPRGLFRAAAAVEGPVCPGAAG